MGKHDKDHQKDVNIPGVGGGLGGGRDIFEKRDRKDDLKEGWGPKIEKVQRQDDWPDPPEEKK